MENLKGVDLIMKIASELIVEASITRDKDLKNLRLSQASCIIKGCSDMSSKSLMELIMMSKELSLKIGRDFSKFERQMDGNDILKQVFNEEKDNTND